MPFQVTPVMEAIRKIANVRKAPKVTTTPGNVRNTPDAKFTPGWHKPIS